MNGMNGMKLTEQISMVFPRQLHQVLVAIKEENDLTKQAVYCLSQTEYQTLRCKHLLEMKQYTGPLNANELLAETLKTYLIKREAETELKLTPIKI